MITVIIAIAIVIIGATGVFWLSGKALVSIGNVINTIARGWE